MYKSILLQASAICFATGLFAQNLKPLQHLNELNIASASVQFKCAGTGQYIVLKPAPQGGGSLEGSAMPDPTAWSFYQAQGAAPGNVEIKRKSFPRFNWSNYDNADDKKAAITWNHAKRLPNTTTPDAPHDWTIEEVGTGVYRLREKGGQYLELMPDLRLDWLKGTGPKIITRALQPENPNQLWSIELSDGAAPASSNHLTKGQMITEGEKLVSSNGEYSLRILAGRLTIMNKSNQAVWECPQAGANQFSIGMADGNLCFQKLGGEQVWCAPFPGNAEKVVLENDGRLVAYGSFDTILWANR